MMNNINICNRAILETFYRLEENFHKINHEYINTPSDTFSTSFKIITASGVKMSIAHTIDTGCGLETILLNDNNSLNHDTLQYHESREQLIEYILAFPHHPNDNPPVPYGPC